MDEKNWGLGGGDVEGRSLKVGGAKWDFELIG